MVSDQGDKIEFAAEWLNSELNIDLVADYVDLSHVPSKPSEMFDRPGLGECCNGMCMGDRCFAGTAFLFKDDHCNNCCFHLVTNGSCSDYSCTCYANDQSGPVARSQRRDDGSGGTQMSYDETMRQIDRVTRPRMKDHLISYLTKYYEGKGEGKTNENKK